MQPVRTLKQMESLVKEQETPKMAVAFAQDEETIKACYRAARESIVHPVLVGDEEMIRQKCRDLDIDPGHFDIINEPDEKESGRVSVRLIAEKKAQMLMKGLISTPYFLRAILDKELDLLPKNALISHSTLLEVSAYDKLLMLSDVAMIPLPDVQQKVKMINYNIPIFKKLGISTPRVALVSANEKVSGKMPSTVDAAVISKMAERRQIKGAIVDGPLAFDVAISPKACEIKKLKSAVEGQADMIIFPDIVSGNIFFKSVTLFAGGTLAGILTGIPFPTVLVSRADSDDTKYYSIVYGAVTL